MSEKPRPQNLKVAAADDGMRLDKWLKKHHPIPMSLLQKLLRKGAIRVDGKRVKSDTKLAAGQEVKIPRVEAGSAKEKVTFEATPEEVKKHITDRAIYEDKNFLAINKLPGIPVQGGTGVGMSIDVLIKGTGYRLTHRLDKDTSGVLLLAKTREAAQAATAAFKDRTFKKTYWALAVGVPQPYEGTIKVPLSEATPGGWNEMTMVDEENGKRAVTHYRVVETAGKRMCWLELEPETGRKHQIRAHLAAISNPVAADGKYGGKGAFIEGISKNLHLHARSLSHPGLMGKKLDISAPLPNHMRTTWQLLEWDIDGQPGR